MSTQELKKEIQKVIDEVPETVLIDILEYLKQFQTLSKDKVGRIENLQQILREDKELLQPLAE
jgi:hypothetical protein